ncbi:hypothetical protein ACHAWF_014428 [Thalassiosira exigua]
MQYSELRTATLRSIFAGVYAANFIVAALHFGKGYLDVLSSIIIMVLALCMLTITVQQPERLMVYFETTGKEIVFTWRMRSAADITQILFLIAQGALGEIMAIITGVLLFVAFSLAQKRPDIFRELFRKHAGDPVVGGEGDGPESLYQKATAETPSGDASAA